MPPKFILCNLMILVLSSVFILCDQSFGESNMIQGIGEDLNPPVVKYFQISPKGLVLGNSFMINYTISDSGGSGLNRVELRRTEPNREWPDKPIEKELFSSMKSEASGSFQDEPSSKGSFLYSLKVIDNSDNWNDESNSMTKNRPGIYGPIKVNVVQPKNEQIKTPPETIDGIIAQQAEALKDLYGVEDCDYIISNDTVLFIIGDDANSPINVALFDLNQNVFLNDLGKARILYFEYYLKEHKSDIINTLTSKLNSQEANAEIIKNFSGNAAIELGWVIGAVTGYATTVVNCIGVKWWECAPDVASLVADAKLSEAQGELTYDKILLEVGERKEVFPNQIDQIEKIVENANTELEIADLIQSVPGFLEIAEETKENLALIESLKGSDLLNAVHDTLLERSIKETSFKLSKEGATTLLDMAISPGDYRMVTRFGSLANWHAEVAKVYTQRARKSLAEFDQDPSIDSYKRAIRDCTDSYDNLAIGYFLMSAIIESQKDSPTGWISSSISDSLNSIADIAHSLIGIDLGSTPKVDDLIRTYKDLAKKNLEWRKEAQQMYEESLYLFSKISVVGIPEEISSEVKFNGSISRIIKNDPSGIISYGIKVDQVNTSFSEFHIRTGDEVILLNNTLLNDTDCTQAGNLYPAGWSPSIGDLVEVYAKKLNPKNITNLDLENSSSVISLCGSYSYSIKLCDLNPPILEDAFISPRTGRVGDVFRFGVTYRDPDGDKPNMACVRILGFEGLKNIFDSSYSNMIQVSGDYSTGARYEYETTLPRGEYQYYFFFSNEKTKTIYLPKEGYPGYFGPAVGMFWPLEPFDVPHSIIQGYGDFSIDKLHNGIDILSQKNVPVFALESGIVARADRIGEGDETLYIKGDHSDRFYQYTHIDIDDRFKKQGTRINAKDLIGRILDYDETGQYKPHLHLAIFDSISDEPNIKASENPINLLIPEPNFLEPPAVRELAFREDDANKDKTSSLKFFQKNAENQYEVCGKVDIVALVADSIGGSETVGPYKLAYSIKGPNYDEMKDFIEWNKPIEDAVGPLATIYEMHPGYPVASIYNNWCIVTNSIENNGSQELNTVGCWDTSSLNPGIYQLSVTAWDARITRSNTKMVDVKVLSNGDCSMTSPASIKAKIIEPIYWPLGEYIHGDLVLVEFPVINTDNPARLSISASIKGPDGAWQKMGQIVDRNKKLLGDPIIMIDASPGLYSFNGLGWVVPENADRGAYDVHIEVKSDNSLNSSSEILDERYLSGSFSIVDAGVKISLLSKENTYQPGDAINLTASVSSEINESISVWPAIRCRDQEGKEVDSSIININVSQIILVPGEKKNISIELQLPSDALEGDYQISIDCFRDEAQTQKLRDNIDWENAFRVAVIPPLLPMDVVMVLDRSGSMSDTGLCNGSKMDEVKEYARSAASACLYDQSPNRLGLISFSDDVRVNNPISSNLPNTLKSIDMLSAGGATSFGLGLFEALNQIKSQGKEGFMPVIIFLSDGMHNTCPPPYEDGVCNIYPPYYDFVMRCKEDGIKIFTIGVGSRSDQTKLAFMAEATGGTWHFAENCSEMEDVILKILLNATGRTIIDTINFSMEANEEAYETKFIPSGMKKLIIILNSTSHPEEISVHGPKPDRLPVKFSIDKTEPWKIFVENPEPGNYTVRLKGIDLGSNGSNPLAQGRIASSQTVASNNSTPLGMPSGTLASPGSFFLAWPIIAAKAMERESKSTGYSNDLVASSRNGLREEDQSHEESMQEASNKAANYEYLKYTEISINYPHQKENADLYPIGDAEIIVKPEVDYLWLTVVSKRTPVDIMLVDQNDSVIKPTLSDTRGSTATVYFMDPEPGVYNLLLYHSAPGDIVYISNYTAPPPFNSFDFNIIETSGKDLQNIPVLLTISGDNFRSYMDDSSHLFVYENGKKCDFWVEEWNESIKEGKIWVKMPFIPANSKDSAITVKYDKRGISNPSDPRSIFELYDDFNDEYMDDSLWKWSSQSEAYVAEENGFAHLYALNNSRSSVDLVSLSNFSSNVAVRFRAHLSKGLRGDHKGLGFMSDNVAIDSNMIGPSVYFRGQDSDLFAHHTYPIDNQKVKIETIYKRLKSNYLSGYRVGDISWLELENLYRIDDTSQNSKVRGLPLVMIPVRFSLNTSITSAPSEIFIDWVLVRKCASKEPIVTLVKN